MRKITVVVLMASLLMLFSTLAPAFAKNFNYPEGQDISYFSGGVGVIATPTGYFGSATAMRIRANNVEIGTGGSGDNIEIDLGFISEGEFMGVRRYLRKHAAGTDPWNEAIERNLAYLKTLLENNDLDRLRRVPKLYIGEAPRASGN